MNYVKIIEAVHTDDVTAFAEEQMPGKSVPEQGEYLLEQGWTLVSIAFSGQPAFRGLVRVVYAPNTGYIRNRYDEIIGTWERGGRPSAQDTAQELVSALGLRMQCDIADMA